jgi:hypothetical protein
VLEKPPMDYNNKKDTGAASYQCLGFGEAFKLSR